MFITKKLNDQFNAAISHVNNKYNSVDASGAAIVIIHNNKVVEIR